MTDKEFFKQLNSIPRAEYAPVPFWSWNNDIETSEAERQIEEMKVAGYGGFIIHARAGLTTEYLSEKWFEVVSACVEKAEKEGLCVWFYDEFGYPSGFVGGELLKDEKNLAPYLECEKIDKFDKTALACYEKVGEDFKRVYETCEKGEYYAVYKRLSPCNVDILNPDVVSLFIQKTYDKYYERFKKYFGNVVRGFFTDEPQYYRYATPYSPAADKEFEKKFGEDIKDGLIYLFYDFESGYRFRTRYYSVLNKLYTVNYYKRLYDWCDERGAELTGHTVEEPHLFSQMWGSADAMPSYLYEHIPGIDHLCRGMDGVMDEIQVESVAAQTGRKQIMSESFACSGYSADLRMLKYIGDYEYALGVNYLVVHLMNYSLQGGGAKDFPQTFSRQDPWWDNYADFLKYFTRLGYIFAETEEKADVLVVHAIRDVYLTYDRFKDKSSVERIEDDFYKFSKDLAENGVQYHYLDESIAEKIGKAENGKITLGEKSYGTVILPNRRSIKKSTYNLLEKFVGQGGKLCVTGEFPTLCDGEKADFNKLNGSVSLEEIIGNNKTVKADGKVLVRKTSGKLGDFIFILNTEEAKTVTVEVDISYGRADILTEKIEKTGGKITLRPHESVLLKKYDFAEEANVYSETKDVTDKFVLESITKNNLIVDFAEASFDGVHFGKKKHIEQISDELIRTKHIGETYLKYRFSVSEKPIKLNLLAQNNNLSEITVNGKKVNISDSDFDVKFYEADISEATKTGENEIVFKINYYQSPVVYDTLYGEGITESMVNMLVYNTIIEPIYVQSDCFLDENLRIGKSKLPLESAAFSNLTENGYKFFAGKAEIVGKVNLKGESHKIKLIGDYISADVYVNGKKMSGCVLDNECVLSGAKNGENEIRIVLKSSLRNMFGPLHLKGIQEDWGIGPDAFTFPGKWRHGIPDNFTADYTVVPFGIKKIEIES